MLWFLVCLCYLYGTLYLSPGRHHNIDVLAVDFDGGVIGQSVQAAYQQLEGPTFFTLHFKSVEEFPDREAMTHSIWKGDYWAAISANEGASNRLSAALQGGQAASTYNASDALHFVWNQQYYTTFANGIVLGHMNQLIGATRLAYNKINGTQASASMNSTSPAAVQALLNPIAATQNNIAVAGFGTVILMNTVSMAMPVLQQFFFLLVLNGVLGAHNMYLKMTVTSSLLFRRIAGVFFTLGASLCQTGYYWAFRENWNVNGTQFVLTWMTFWLLMHIHLLILDTISTLAPLPAMPFVVLFWVLINISSTLSPLELQAGFYRWGYALPSNEAYSVLMTIWSGGAHNRLYRALPILFAWWVVANFTTSLAHIRACHLAFKVEHKDEEPDTESVDAVKPKDEEEGPPTEEVVPAEREAGDDLSHSTTVERKVSRTQSRINRTKSRESVVLEQRKVYGPSIPPFA